MYIIILSTSTRLSLTSWFDQHRRTRCKTKARKELVVKDIQNIHPKMHLLQKMVGTPKNKTELLQPQVRKRIMENRTGNINKSERQTEYDRIKNLGQYGVKGGPGRELGSKNKFTLIKEQIAEVWAENNGKNKFKEMFNEDFSRAIDKIIAVMPKEKEESSTENHFHLTVFNFDSTKRDNNSSSRVHGVDTPVAT